MADDKKAPAPADLSRIALDDEVSVRYWTQKLGVPRKQLEDAVAAVGDNADTIEEHFHSR
jgi:hypothetical protein